MENMGYYLVLGAGENQVPLIRAAREQGYLVIGVDLDINAPGLEYCDIRVEESIYNYRKIDYKLSIGLMNGKIVGGYSGSFGSALHSWAYLAERFLLPAPSRTLMELLTNKYEVRKRLSTLNFPKLRQPDMLTFEESVLRDEIEALGFPLIIKTRRGYGKKNIFLLKKYSEIRQFLTRKNLAHLDISPDELMIEQYIQADEIIVIGLIHDFEFTLISVTDKRHSREPPFIDLEHRWPSQFHANASEITEMHRKIVESLQIPVGTLVSEWKVKDGKYYLIELSPQIPGEMLGTFLIPKIIGYDYFKNLVNVTTGRKPEKLIRPKKKTRGRVLYFDKKPPKAEWDELLLKASFSKVLNKSPGKEILSNSERYGVMGFLE